MARQYTTTTRTYEDRRIESITCDWCKQPIKLRDSGETSSVGHVTDIRVGKQYTFPDDCWFEGWLVEDLCAECGKKLRKLLEDNGITVMDTKEEQHP